MTQKVYSFIEHRVALEDNLFQIMTDPVEFTMLNLEKIQGIKALVPTSQLLKEDQSAF